jgi:regulator of sigma E protease
VGFGNPIYRRTIKGVEYCIGWIPLGGYVALPQLDAADTPQTFDGKDLPHVSALDRIIVAFAGPLFNIALGFVLSVLVWQFGIDRLPNESRVEVGYVDAVMIYDDAPRWTPEYAAGLRAGDVVTAVNGESFERGWEEINERIIFAHDKRVVLDIERDGEAMKIEYEMLGSSRAEGLWLPNFEPGYDVVVAGIPADPKYPAHGKLGMDDLILAAEGVPVRSPGHLVELIRERGDRPVTLTVQSVGSDRAEDITLTPVEETWITKPKVFMLGFEWASMYPLPWVTAVPDGTQAAAGGLQVDDLIMGVDGKPIITIEDAGKHAAEAVAAGRPLRLKIRRGPDIMHLEMEAGSTPGTENIFTNLTGAEVEIEGYGVAKVTPGSPSEAAGLQVGDRVLALGGRPIKSVSTFAAQLQENRGKEVPLTIRRDGEDMDLMVSPRHMETMESTTFVVGVQPAWRKVKLYPTPFAQFGRTAGQIQVMVARIANRNNPIQVKHMSTFPGIALIMKQSITSGAMNFINLLVFINFMLAIVNLFPIPILDGGHIVFGLAEIVSRRRLPTKPVRILQYACFAMLLGFIAYVLWYDVARVGRITENWFNRAQPAEINEAPPPPPEPAPAPAPFWFRSKFASFTG